jgi:hypothetical protein
MKSHKIKIHMLALEMAVLLAGVASAQAQIYQWATIAGKAGSTGSADGTNSAIRLRNPRGVSVGGEGQLFVSDSLNGTIRRLALEGTNWVAATIAGKAGTTGSADGTNSAIRLGYSWGTGNNSGVGPAGVDGSGHVFVADYLNHAIRELSPEGTNWVSTTIGGLAGSPGSADGTGSEARFNFPGCVSPDSAGNLYVLDSYNSTIRKLTREGTHWVAATIAGLAGSPGSADGTNSAARFNFNGGNGGLAVDRAGNILVADNGSHTIRKVSPVGASWVTTTIAGKAGVAGSLDGTNSGARFTYPTGIAVDRAGGVYVAELLNQTIRKLVPEGTNWVTATIGGKAGAIGSADGTNSIARFNGPCSAAVDGRGNLYVAQWDDSTIRLGVPLPVFQSVTPASGRIELSLSAAPGQTVQLQSSSDLASATWTNLGNPLTATGGTIPATDTPAPGQPRFYRAIVVRP